MRLKALIIDDHPIYAEALQQTIERAFPEAALSQVGTFTAGEKFLSEHRDLDMVLLDLWLPDTHGFGGLMKLRETFPNIPVVIVSAFADATVINRTMVCGAAGFIPKSADKNVIAETIHRVMEGSSSFPEDLAPAMPVVHASPVKRSEPLERRLNLLTRQQLRVLQMLCQGMLNKQIAHSLDVGETTVKAHVSEILRKLAVASRTQAVLEVSRLNFDAVLALYAGESTPAPDRMAS